METLPFLSRRKKAQRINNRSLASKLFYQILPLEFPRLLYRNGFGVSLRSNLSYLETAHQANIFKNLIAHFATSQGILKKMRSSGFRK
tara:strand:- start:597 stop:860 length:264 start_codon:yes stop_codon:yes gene_type:complete